MTSKLRLYIAAILLGAWGLGGWQTTRASGQGLDAMVQVRLGQGLVEGKPLVWNNSRVDLMSRDGRLVSFSPSAAKDFRKSGPRFYSYSPSEMRARLHAEFGRDFDVATTVHYLVVYPRGQKNNWAERFEELYRSFVHYFQVRGLKVRETQFPLVAVVFKSQQDMRKYAADSGAKVPGNYLGYYAIDTNRVCLFDDGRAAGADWAQTFETVIHEAAHQTAFNTGVHTRFAGTPRWLSEGLAMAFEARGVNDSSKYRRQADRINRGRLIDFKEFSTSRPEGFLEELIASDRPFTRDPARAYADAWALTFYLCETQPRRYADYLVRTAARKPFEEYSAADRLTDFKKIFGDNLRLVEAQFLRYMERIR